MLQRSSKKRNSQNVQCSMKPTSRFHPRQKIIFKYFDTNQTKMSQLLHSRDFFRQNGAHFIVVVRTHYSGAGTSQQFIRKLNHKDLFEFSCTPCTLLSIRLIHRFLLVKPDVWKLSILQHFNFISHKKSFLGQNDCKITHVHLKVHIS